MTKNNYWKMVQISKVMIRLVALEESTKIAVTFWPDNYDEYGVGAVDSVAVGELLTQKEIQKAVKRKIRKLNIEYRKLANTFPKKIRLKVKRKASSEARQDLKFG